MTLFDEWALTLAVFLPLVGMALVLLIPRGQETAVKAVALITSLVTLGVGVGILTQFNYGKAGILDRTHTRLFTFRSLRRLLVDAGFRIKTVRGVPAPFPKVFGDGVLGRTGLAINNVLIAISKSLFAYQIFIVAETTPDVDFILADTKRRAGLPASQRSTSSTKPDSGLSDA